MIAVDADLLDETFSLAFGTRLRRRLHAAALVCACFAVCVGVVTLTSGLVYSSLACLAVGTAVLLRDCVFCVPLESGLLISRLGFRGRVLEYDRIVGSRVTESHELHLRLDDGSRLILRRPLLVWLTPPTWAGIPHSSRALKERGAAAAGQFLRLASPDTLASAQLVDLEVVLAHLIPPRDDLQLLRWIRTLRALGASTANQRSMTIGVDLLWTMAGERAVPDAARAAAVVVLRAADAITTTAERARLERCLTSSSTELRRVVRGILAASDENGLVAAFEGLASSAHGAGCVRR